MPNQMTPPELSTINSLSGDQAHIEKPWYILGAGAIGSLWATKLLAQNIPCTILSRHADNNCDSPSLETITVTHLDNSENAYSVAVQPSNSRSIKPIDKLIVCTKSYQTVQAIESIRQHISDNAIILLLQNGMGQHEQVAQLLAKQYVIAGTTTQGALLVDARSVRHTGAGSALFGYWRTEQQKNINNHQQVFKQLTAIGMQYHQHIQQVLWDKLAVNCVINPLTAIYNCRNGALNNENDILQHATSIANEVDLISQALGFYNPANSTLQRALEVAHLTAQNYSSMQQDIEHQRKTEIAFINGYLQAQAQQLNIDCPYNDSVIRQVSQLESTFR
ncbi:2-dehydropantoate 2-reductase [Gammaproteobacteria bacterium AS21]|jgi:2-dehydropantoate 2-reductase